MVCGETAEWLGERNGRHQRPYGVNRDELADYSGADAKVRAHLWKKPCWQGLRQNGYEASRGKGKQRRHRQSIAI